MCSVSCVRSGSTQCRGGFLRNWFELHVLPGVAGRILPLGLADARAVAPLHVPDPAPERDALIAGTALARSLTIVTRNERDFTRFAVEVINPWAA
jgi:toxin FitB